MRVKTNVVLSVLVGGFPVVRDDSELNEWLAEYNRFVACLPSVSVKGLDGKKKYELNYEACRRAILNSCPEFNMVDNFVSFHARKQIMTGKIVENGRYTKDYLSFCNYLIDYAQEETGRTEHDFIPFESQR